MSLCLTLARDWDLFIQLTQFFLKIVIFIIQTHCFMNVSELRLTLIDKIMHMKEEALLNAKALLSETDTDWWELLSPEERNEIDEGLSEADNGKYISHDSIMSKFDKWK